MLTDALSHLPDPQRRPDEDLERAEAWQVLVDVLQSLSDADREILQSHFLEDATYDQLAGRLGLSYTAVRSRVHRAQERLRRCASAVIGALAALLGIRQERAFGRLPPMKTSQLVFTVAAIGLGGVLGVGVGLKAVMSATENADMDETEVAVDVLTVEPQPLSAELIKALRQHSTLPKTYTVKYAHTATVHRMLPERPPSRPDPQTWLSFHDIWDGDSHSPMERRSAGSLAVDAQRHMTSRRFFDDDSPLRAVYSTESALREALTFGGIGRIGGRFIRPRAVRNGGPVDMDDPVNWLQFEQIPLHELLTSNGEHYQYGKLVDVTATTVWVDGEKCVRVRGRWQRSAARMFEQAKHHPETPNEVRDIDGSTGGRIAVLGYVEHPGFYEIARPVGVPEALALAGGTVIGPPAYYESISTREGKWPIVSCDH